MKFGSVCSGIEAASVAWHPLGWQAAWLSEIEPFPSAVLKYHYPDVPNLGDMTLLPDRIASGEVEAPDLFCGGTPCQAFSVAGLRKSLDDARGNLSLVFCEIANAIDNRRQDAGLVPGIIFWENVPGVLSTKDNAFGCFIAGLAGEADPVEPPRGKWPNAGVVLGPQRTVAWRILDAQYFGLAQRRRRVFVVASARDDIDPASILLEFDGVRRDSAPSREARKVTPTISSSGTGVSRVGFNCKDEWFIETPVVAALDTQCGGKSLAHQSIDNKHIFAARMVAFGEYVDDDTASAMKARDYKDATDLVAQPIPIHDQATRHAGRNGEKTAGKGNGLGIGNPGDPAPTLTGGDKHAVAQPIAFNARQDPDAWAERTGPLDTDGSTQAVCVTGEITHTLKAEGFDASEDGTGRGQPIVPQSMAVRRLTPTECERLQGFPDGYTNVPWRGKDESPDGPRYKALGNSWAVPVVRWIGTRIANAVSF
jgi:DNA (cytosine-5)-methyltransferase 1